jgi:aminoglycoside phosphotransferase (APT) family kinase protein
MWSHLNQHVPADDPAYSDARRRVLSRLGEYAASVIGPLNLRPTAATLLSETPERVEVRVSTPARHVVLVISPEGDLSSEVFFLRAVAVKNVPAPQMIQYDLSRTAMPFAYALEGYVSGSPASTLSDGPLLRMVARQTGRALRRIHSIAAPGCGQPLANGRWPARSWSEALRQWLEQREWSMRAQEVLGAPLLDRLHAATLDHAALAFAEPRVIHGALDPAHVSASVGESAQLEALVRPGMLVGGDPMFDLAHALLPCRPAAFRQGVWEAYMAAGALDTMQMARFERLRLLLHAASTLNRAAAEELDRLPDDIAAALRELEA